jgi:hypothetical protein
MIKLRYSKRLFKRSSSSKQQQQQQQAAACGGDNGVGGGAGEIEWEVRPGGMLVQKRNGRGGQEMVTVRVSTGFSWHDVSIAATSTFGEYCTAPASLMVLALSVSFLVDLSGFVFSCSHIFDFVCGC